MSMQPDAFAQWREVIHSREQSRVTAENRLRGILYRQHRAAEDVANNAPLRRLPSKSAQSAAAKSGKYVTRHSAAGRVSMVNMPAPAGHIPLPRFPSEKERAMFAAHERRKSAGWIRG